MDEKPNIEEKRFIQENVSKKRTPMERMILQVLKVVGLGVLFGISALITMALLRPAALGYISSQTQNSSGSAGAESSGASASVEDVTGSAAGSNAEGDAGSGGAALTEGDAAGSAFGTESADPSNAAGSATDADTAQSASTPSGSDNSASAAAHFAKDDSSDDTSPTADELSAMWQEISDMGNNIDRYIVDVCSIQNATDWFDNQFEKKDVYSGIIISSDDDEVCVLTVSSAVSSADSLKVSLTDGRLFPAAVRSTDSVAGLAVICFDPEDENMVSAEIIEETQAQEDSEATGQTAAHSSAASDKEYEPIEAISLDTSGRACRGDLVIAAGSPRGISHSIAYSWLSYTTDPISITDGTTKLFYADRDMDFEKGTWIIDLDGRLIGWLCDDIKQDSADSQVIMSIADYRDILETMIEGEERAYLGVSVIDADTMHSGPDYPEGVYVKSVAFGGPAYNSGLQPGDYIADIGGHRITSLRSFKYAMNHIQAGSTVTILIYRQSKEEYKNIVFEVETGSRSSQ